MLVAIQGFIGSGKDTMANILVKKYNFTKESFASPVKDVCSIIFGWDRELLEGDTKDSRIWREQVDVWWAKHLGIPNFSPRYALQHIGTDVLREHFNDDIWLLSLKRRYESHENKNVVISDLRFPNEIEMMKKMGCVFVQISRGIEPEWLPLAVRAAQGDNSSIETLQRLNIHQSEWAWIGKSKIDCKVVNDGSIKDLERKVAEFYQTYYTSRK